MPLPTAPRARAHAYAIRFASILAFLMAAIARSFIKNPRLIIYTLPIHARFARLTRRFTKLMATLAAGRLPAPPRPRPNRVRNPRKPSIRLPRSHAWLLRALGHEAAGAASQLSHMLAEPQLAALLAEAPEAAARIINPLRGMLIIREAGPNVPHPTHEADLALPDNQWTPLARLFPKLA